MSHKFFHANTFRQVKTFAMDVTFECRNWESKGILLYALNHETIGLSKTYCSFGLTRTMMPVVQI